jgi:indolepyruvate ferredoxin oxidoreductase, beta subunit
MKAEIKNILIVGVGGQGVILASDILTDVLGDIESIEVKKTETHGMSQRGGSVHAQIRYGKNIASPFISPGEADIILAFEEAEGLRYAHYLTQEGKMILNSMQIIPPLVNTGLVEFPYEAINELTNNPNVKRIKALKIASDLGNEKVVSVVLLGALAKLLDFDDNNWLDKLKTKLPKKVLSVNLKAFAEGKKALQ